MHIECLVILTYAINYAISHNAIDSLQPKVGDCELAEANLPYSSTDMIISAEYVVTYLLNETKNKKHRPSDSAEFLVWMAGDWVFVEYSRDEAPNYIPYYFPQLPVQWPDKSTTMIRVVFQIHSKDEPASH